MGNIKEANKIIKKRGYRPGKTNRDVVTTLMAMGELQWVKPLSKDRAKRILKQYIQGDYQDKEEFRNTKKGRQDFLQSWQWKKLRYEVLKHYKKECMLCGAQEKLVVDHIKPISKYPDLRLNFDNLQILCNDCNQGKSNDDETDWRPANVTG